jgi:MFS transporter, DHA1 family, multidrug resistance protein
MRNIFGIYAGIFCGYMGNALYIPHLIATLGSTYSGTIAGLVIFCTSLGRMMGSFLGGGLSDRYGRKNVIFVGVILEAFALLVYGFISHPAYYALAAIFVGLSSGVSFPGLKATLTELPKEQHAIAFSRFTVASNLGAIVGALLGILFSGGNLRLIFIIVFFIFLGYAFSIGKLLKISSEAKHDAKIFTWKHPRNWQIGSLIGFYLVSSFFWICYAQFLIGIPLHIGTYANWLPVSTHLVITGIVMILALTFSLYPRISKRIAYDYLLIGGMSLVVCASVLLGLGKSGVFVIFGATIAVFAELLFVPAFDMWVTSRTDRASINKAMGTMNFFRSFGGSLGNLTAGIMFDLSITLHIPGLNWLILAVFGLFCVFYIARGVHNESTR